jgi:tetratricopeptide (TPR) repeat protein
VLFIDFKNFSIKSMKKILNFIANLFKEKKLQEMRIHSTKSDFDKELVEIDEWYQKQEKSKPFANKGIEYHCKARECENPQKAKELYLKSIVNWGKVVEITNEPDDYNHLLNICWEAELIDKVEYYLNQWLSKYPKDADAHSHLASLYEVKGNREKAKAELEFAISLKPDNHYNLQELGRLYEEDGNVEKAIEIYGKIIKYFSDEVDSAIHCGAYDPYIDLCLKNNKVEEIKILVKDVFNKIERFINGEEKPKKYSGGDREWYINKKKEFAIKLSNKLIKRIKQLLKEDKILMIESLIILLDEVLTYVEEKSIHFESYLLEGIIFRKLGKLDKSWGKYNKALLFCQQDKEISKVYAGMGEQLLEENKIQLAVTYFLYALALNQNSLFAKRGLNKVKKIFKSKCKSEKFEELIENTKNYIDFKVIQEKTHEFFNSL